MHTPETNFDIHTLIKKTYEGGKLYSHYRNEALCKEEYKKAVRKGWFGLFITVCLSGLVCLYLSAYANPTFEMKILSGLSDDWREVISLYYYMFLLSATPITLISSAFTLQSSNESLSNISYFEENPEGIREIEASKQSMTEFANDKQTLVATIKHVDSSQLLKLITDDSTQQWAKKILESEAQERSKWIYNPLNKY